MTMNMTIYTRNPIYLSIHPLYIYLSISYYYDYEVDSLAYHQRSREQSGNRCQHHLQTSPDRQIGRWIGRQIDRQMDRQIDSWIHRQIGRQQLDRQITNSFFFRKNYKEHIVTYTTRSIKPYRNSVYLIHWISVRFYEMGDT